ncbi:MAG TPA: hypothetical protein VN890_06890 [Methylocella sp.]|nr:hypothetical protein [Methylocella sp.]
MIDVIVERRVFRRRTSEARPIAWEASGTTAIAARYRQPSEGRLASHGGEIDVRKVRGKRSQK